MDTFLISRPSKPEEADSKGHSSSHDMRKSPFRHVSTAVCRELSSIPRLGQNDRNATYYLPNNHSKIWKATHPFSKAVYSLEDDRIGRHKQVQKSIKESGIEAQKQDYWLGYQDLERPAEILLHELDQVDFNLFLFSVDTPVSSPSSQL